MKRRIAVLVDISEPGWETCVSSVNDSLEAAGYEHCVQQVHLGSGRSWRHMKPFHENTISRRDFFATKAKTEKARDFLSWHSDALLVLPLKETKALRSIVAGADSLMKLGRKNVLTPQTGVQLGVADGETPLGQYEFFVEAMKLLETILWK